MFSARGKARHFRFRISGIPVADRTRRRSSGRRSGGGWDTRGKPPPRPGSILEDVGKQFRKMALITVVARSSYSCSMIIALNIIISSIECFVIMDAHTGEDWPHTWCPDCLLWGMNRNMYHWMDRPSLSRRTVYTVSSRTGTRWWHAWTFTAGFSGAPGLRCSNPHLPSPDK